MIKFSSKVVIQFLAITVAIAASGCANQMQGGSTQRQTSSDAALPSTPLRDVYVLGSNRSMYDAPNIKLDPLLNPRTPPPPLKEDSNLTSACSPNTKLGLADDNGGTLVDDTRFQQIMRAGLDNAEARHVWKFNQARYEAQLKKVSGPRTVGRSEREAVMPRPSSNRPNAAPSSPEAAVRDAVRGALGLLKPASTPSRPDSSVAAQLNKHLPDFDKMREDLAYNAQILAAQDEALRSREREYSEQLWALYQDAFLSFKKTPSSQISLATLNQFDSFRFKNIFTCESRGETTASSKQRDQAISTEYDPMAQQIIASNRGSLLKAIRSTKSSLELQTVYQNMLSTSYLREAASQDPSISQALQQHSTTLLAQEEREREESRKRAEAEAARQAVLLKKKYLQNASRNAAPTADEVGTLFSAYDAEINQKYRKFRIERINAESFVVYAKIPLFGEFKVGQVDSEVINLSCKPEQNRQRCSFTEKRMITEYNLGVLTVTYPGDNSGQVRDEIFHWDASGLHSPNLKSEMIEETKRLIARRAEAAARSMEASQKTCTTYTRRFGTQVGSVRDCH